MSEQTPQWEWTQAHGDRYRARYDHLTFKDKQYICNKIQTVHAQTPFLPEYLMTCLETIGSTDAFLLELGGYDGSQALSVLKQYPLMTWYNYDISAISEYLTRKELNEYYYEFVLLNQPFIETALPTFCNIFYTSRTLEHFKWDEIVRIITKTQSIPHQVHVIDWFWKNDTHVVEKNYHNELTRLLRILGYDIRDEFIHPERSHIFASK